MHNWIAVLIAFGVLLIGYAQWRTANQRAVLDLFERRLAAYYELESAIGGVMREGIDDGDAFRRYLNGRMQARFLFGTDVLEFLDSIYDDVIALQTIYRDDVIDHSAKRVELTDNKFAALRRVSGFAERAPAVFGPYMNMTARNTPFWRPW
jgi:hypothetical protein